MNKKFVLVVIFLFIITVLAFAVSCQSASGNQTQPEIQDNFSTEQTGGTLTQDKQVDEGDIVKMFGENIYKLQSDGLVIYKADQGILLPVCYYRLSQRAIPFEMYVTDDNIVLVYGRTGEIGENYVDSKDCYSSYYNQDYDKTIIEVIKNPNSDGFTHDAQFNFDLSPYKKYSFSLSGTLIASRMYVTNKMAYFAFSTPFSYTTENTVTTTDDIITTEQATTTYTISYEENGTQKKFRNLTAVPGIESLKTNSSTVFMALDTNNLENNCIINGVYGAQLQDIYMSEDSIVPIFYQNNVTKEKIGGCYGYTYYNRTTNTYCFKIKTTTLEILDKTAVTLKDYSIYDRRAIKDFGDVIYITAQKTDGSGSRVIALDGKTFALLNTLEKIAPNENVKSVAYSEENGKRYCYITTFLQIDPLFKIDITDPYSMVTLGFMEMPGFATFMLPIGDKLLTLGYNDNGRQYANSTLKIAMYASNENEFNTIDQRTISNVYYCEAIDDPRVIAIDNDMFAISVTRNDKSNDYAYTQCLYVFQLTENEIVHIGTITNFYNGYTNYIINNDNKQASTSWGRFALSITRARFYQDYIYAFSDATISSYKIDKNNPTYKVSTDYTNKVTTSLEQTQFGYGTIETVQTKLYLKELISDINRLTTENITKIKYKYSPVGVAPGNLASVQYTNDTQDVTSVYTEFLNNCTATLIKNYEPEPGGSYCSYTFYYNNANTIDSLNITVINGVLYYNGRYYNLSANITPFNYGVNYLGFITNEYKCYVHQYDNPTVVSGEYTGIDRLEFTTCLSEYSQDDFVYIIDSDVGMLYVIDKTHFVYKEVLYELTDNHTFDSLFE